MDIGIALWSCMLSPNSKYFIPLFGAALSLSAKSFEFENDVNLSTRITLKRFKHSISHNVFYCFLAHQTNYSVSHNKQNICSSSTMHHCLRLTLLWKLSQLMTSKHIALEAWRNWKNIKKGTYKLYILEAWRNWIHIKKGTYFRPDWYYWFHFWHVKGTALPVGMILLDYAKCTPGAVWVPKPTNLNLAPRLPETKTLTR